MMLRLFSAGQSSRWRTILTIEILTHNIMKNKSLLPLVIGNLLLLLSGLGNADESAGTTNQQSLGTMELSMSYDKYFESCPVGIPQKIKGVDFFAPYSIQYDFHDKRKYKIDLKLADFRLETKEGKIIPLPCEGYDQIERSDMTIMERTLHNKREISHRFWLPIDLKKYKGAKIKYNVPKHGKGKAGSTLRQPSPHTILVARKDAEPYEVIARFLYFPRIWDLDAKDNNAENNGVIVRHNAFYALFTPKYLQANPNVEFSLRTEKNRIVPLNCEALSKIRNSKLNDDEKSLKRLRSKSLFSAYKVILPIDKVNPEIDDQLSIVSGVDSPWIVRKSGKKAMKQVKK